MTTLLAGDIGGTKTILRLVNADSSQGSLPMLTALYEDTYPSQEYADLVPIVLQFLNDASKTLGQSFNLDIACFGIAGPVVENTSELTNLNWSLSSDRLQVELKVASVKLINDFAAIGYGILGLQPEDVFPLQAPERSLNAPIAVLGAGTGLGEGFLIPTGGDRYRVFPSEGSHADFAPRSALEYQLLVYLREKYDISRVSVERVVSGMGIASIYQFLRQQSPELESEELAKVYQIWEQELGKISKTVDLAAQVSKTALEGDDYLCKQTMKLFVEAYGAEAGNLALKLLPYGGLYVAGGIAPKILPLLQAGNFMKAFRAKGRMSDLLELIPVYVVLNAKVGLIGAALCAALSL